MSTTSTLKLDTSKLYGCRYGIAEQAVSQNPELAAKIESAVNSVRQKMTAGEYGFIATLDDDSLIAATQDVFKKISWATTMVVVGIGGSDLGARAVQQALQSDTPPMRVLFHGDSTDPEQIRRLQLHINPAETVFVIISKSGETVETISQYLFWKEAYRSGSHAQDKTWADHFVFVTDQSKGILRKEADSHGVITLPIPDSVGGRFSVMTPVGLLPALAMGVDISQLVAGARSFAASQQDSQAAFEYAISQYQLLQQGVPVSVLMPYSVSLEEFARWYRQLWAESLGKNGTGILPIQARGPADQHSQVQFYAQGAPIMSLLFILINQPEQDFVLPETDIPELQYLTGHSFQKILIAEQQSTAQALFEAGRASATIHVESLNSETFGALFMFFELAVVLLAELLEVNAFDQPGVEDGKRIMRELLAASAV